MERLVRGLWCVVLGVIGLAAAPAALGQQRPYIGFVYPAGGQQGTTFAVRLGGQGVDEVDGAWVTGGGVTAKVVECRRRLGAQETQLLNEQLRELRKAFPAARPSAGRRAAAKDAPVKDVPAMDEASRQLLSKIETRLNETVNRPACNAISNIVIVEVTIAADAEPGRRELTVSTAGGVSNPLVFHVGQLPEVSRKPMISASFQVLGKEELALRKRPEDEVEQRVALPATLNGQIASGEVNRYRFNARKGQRLVITVEARQLNPYVADAVPGWFQPVIALYDERGKEVAFNDDYRFRPDPVILHEVARDGEMSLTITDAIYRGREDFVYRMSVGELPFVTSVFPLGARAGAVGTPQVKGWNLQGGGGVAVPAAGAGPGVYGVAAVRGKVVSNRVPFEIGALPEGAESEPNDAATGAQEVTLPVVLNGRIGRADDWDVFRFAGKAGQTIVAEVKARRLESPLDSVLKVTDAAGNLVAYNDDREDPEAGTNTQDADSYVSFTLPADGAYFVHLGDTARHGGEEYGYRLRISEPQPDFALRIVPSSVTLRSKGGTAVNIQAVRKDGFAGPIRLSLKDAPAGFTAMPTVLGANQTSGRFPIKTDLVDGARPVSLCIEGSATVDGRTIVHRAVPVEDRMQAFLWRHLVPATELKAVVFNPANRPAPKRVPRALASAASQPATQPAGAQTTKPAAAANQKFSKQQVASRLRQLKLLYEDGLLTDAFYHEKVLECEAVR